MKKITFFLFGLVFVFSGYYGQAQDTEKKVNRFKPTVKINGRIQYDFEFMKYENADEWFNGNEFRRLHLSAAGNISKNIKYKVETSFAHASIGFRDVYIKYSAGKAGNFYFGSVAEPTGLNTATSSKYITFFERSMLTSMQNFRWGAGFHYSNFHLLDGKMGLQLALTNNGKHSEGFKDSNLEDGMNFIGRLTGTVINDKEKHQVVHLGVNFDSRPYKDLKFRPENHMGAKYHYVFDGADARSAIGAELGTTFGPISVQGEYKVQSYTGDDLNADYQMSSFYVFGSYFLTGEYRPYKHGGFGRVKPNNPLDNGGLGALELAVRYSSMGASDDVLAVTNNAGLPETINNIAIALNWYPTAHTRFMYNYVITDDGNSTTGKLGAHLIRFAIDF